MAMSPAPTNTCDDVAGIVVVVGKGSPGIVVVTGGVGPVELLPPPHASTAAHATTAAATNALRTIDRRPGVILKSDDARELNPPLRKRRHRLGVKRREQRADVF